MDGTACRWSANRARPGPARWRVASTGPLGAQPELVILQEVASCGARYGHLDGLERKQRLFIAVDALICARAYFCQVSADILTPWIVQPLPVGAPAFTLAGLRAYRNKHLESPSGPDRIQEVTGQRRPKAF